MAQRIYRRLPAAKIIWALLWAAALLVAHSLYAPAWSAGWVRDVSGWLEKIQTQSFGDYLFRRGLQVQSLYPFTQFMLWVGYKLWGSAPLPWHIAMVTAHATIAWGWARFFVEALEPKWGRSALWAGSGAGIFMLLSPYATEVVVWQAGFHYLQGSLLLLVSLWATLGLLRTGKSKWAIGAVAAFIPTLFALESFVLTPVYVALLAVAAGREQGVNAGRLWRWILIPMVVLCVAQYFLFRMLYAQPVPHILTFHFSQLGDWLRKPAKYIFNLFFWGRYWPEGIKKIVYPVLNSHLFLGLFWSAAVLVSLLLFRRQKQVLNSVWLLPAGYWLAALALVTPLYFQDAGLVDFDRYAYFMLPAAGALLGLFISRFGMRRKLAVGVVALSVYFLMCTVQLWRQANRLSNTMLAAIPLPVAGEITLLLNLPNALRGVPVVGMSPKGEAALMRKYVLEDSFPGILLEPSACDLLTVNDTVRVVRTGLQTLQVTALNGQGWWSGGMLSTDWENNYFAVHFEPHKSAYELQLKFPAGRYRLLLWKEGRWIRL